MKASIYDRQDASMASCYVQDLSTTNMCDSVKSDKNKAILFVGQASDACAHGTLGVPSRNARPFAGTSHVPI